MSTPISGPASVILRDQSLITGSGGGGGGLQNGRGERKSSFTTTKGEWGRNRFSFMGSFNKGTFSHAEERAQTVSITKGFTLS